MSRIEAVEFTSGLVPIAEYYCLLPDNYQTDEPLRLLILLHGGGGSRDNLVAMQSNLDAAFSQGLLEPMVVVMPSFARSLYMDFADGSELWQRYFFEEFIPHVQQHYAVRRDKQGTLLSGVSMGGLGALRFAFLRPQMFGAVAVIEPAIDPCYAYSQLRPRNNFYRLDSIFDRIYGMPRNEKHWAQNNPVSVARTNAQSIKNEQLAIYFEAGDEDCLNLHEGAEFLHRCLWQHNIRHEYHLVYGANHLGSTIVARQTEALAFLGRVIKRWQIGESFMQPTPAQQQWLNWMQQGAKGAVQGQPITPLDDAMIPLFEANNAADKTSAYQRDEQGPLGFDRLCE